MIFDSVNKTIERINSMIKYLNPSFSFVLIILVMNSCSGSFVDPVDPSFIKCPDSSKVYYAGGPNRDNMGEYYNTVQIGNQCWLKENLNIGEMIVGYKEEGYQNDNGILEKYCYDNIESNCDKYGGLYQWHEAMQYDSAAGTRGICPEGWHIPTSEEYLILIEDLGSSGLISQEEGGKDHVGFSALLGGHRASNGQFFFKGQIAEFWTANGDGPHQNRDVFQLFSRKFSNKSIDHKLLSMNGGHPNFHGYLKETGCSIRCLKD